MSPATQATRIKTLLRELERFAPLFASATDYVFAKDLSGRYVAANPAYLSALGRRDTEIVGNDDESLFPAEDVREQQARERLVQLSGQVIENDTSFLLNGQPHELRVRRFPWRDAAGRLIGTIGVATDVTAVRAGHHGAAGVQQRGSNVRLQQMLADQKRFGSRMATLLEAGHELVATLDSARIHRVAVDVVEHALEGVAATFMRFNRGTGHWTIQASGLRGTALGQPLTSFAGQDVAFSDDVLQGRVFRRMRTRQGRHPFDVRTAHAGLTGYVAVPVMYERALQAALLAAWSDDAVPMPDEVWFLETLAVQVSLALHNAALYEQLDASLLALKRAQDQASHAHRLQALGQVASGVAHDFNNSLTTILGLSDWLLHELPAETPFYTDLETIRTAAQDAAAMVRRLQMFGRLRPDARHERFETVELSGVARAVAELTRPRCQELAVKTGKAFDVVIDAHDDVLVAGSGAELREMLVNLVFNGLDAMPDGGAVNVWVGIRDGRPEVSVSDTGVGMPDEVKQRVFEPFFSTKGHKGNGLGLSMCEGIAQRHGASLTVESTPGEGSVFTLSFPEAAVAVLESVPEPEDAIATGSLKVLVVDDRADVCDSLAAMVSSLGHAVTKSRDGATALDMAVARRFDVLVTDLGMPGMNGIELARNVAACRPDTAVVLITAWGSEFEAEAAGVGVQVVSKPVTMAALRRALSEAVTRQQPARRGLRLVHSSEAQS